MSKTMQTRVWAEGFEGVPGQEEPLPPGLQVGVVTMKVEGGSFLGGNIRVALLAPATPATPPVVALIRSWDSPEGGKLQVLVTSLGNNNVLEWDVPDQLLLNGLASVGLLDFVEGMEAGGDQLSADLDSILRGDGGDE